MRLRRREKCVMLPRIKICDSAYRSFSKNLMRGSIIREPWEPMLDLNERVAGGREAIRPGAPSRRETQGNLFRVVDRHLG